MRLSFIILISSLPFAATAYEQDLAEMAREISSINCDSASLNGIEDRECFIKGYPEAEIELKKTYQHLYQNAKECDNPKALSILVKSQEAWLKFRDAEAELRAVPNLNAQMFNATVMAAKRDMDKERIQTLKGFICN